MKKNGDKREKCGSLFNFAELINLLKNRMTSISNVTLLVSLIMFTIASCGTRLNIKYLLTLVFFIILTFFIYVSGIIINEEDRYKRNISIYMLMYFVMFICLTMFIGRRTISIMDREHLEYYINSINLTPFKTVKLFVKSNLSNSIIAYNVIGNIVALMPLSLLLIFRNDKYRKIINQLLFLGVTVLIIEVLQLVLSVGSFDIDDFILNIGGGILFILLMNVLNITDKIKGLFYTDFGMNEVIKYSLWMVLFVCITTINITILIAWCMNISTFLGLM